MCINENNKRMDYLNNDFILFLQIGDIQMETDFVSSVSCVQDYFLIIFSIWIC